MSTLREKAGLPQRPIVAHLALIPPASRAGQDPTRVALRTTDTGARGLPDSDARGREASA